jgi:formylmethanofuran dehydrogenase subunit E
MKLLEIGVIHSPYHTPEEAPRQGAFEEKISIIEIHKEYEQALEGIEDCEHLMVLYWADKAPRDILKSERHEKRGVFATRSPARPNPICICVCKLIDIKGRRLKVMGLDAASGSPLLDLKPYIKELNYPGK